MFLRYYCVYTKDTRVFISPIMLLLPASSPAINLCNHWRNTYVKVDIYFLFRQYLIKVIWNTLFYVCVTVLSGFSGCLITDFIQIKFSQLRRNIQWRNFSQYHYKIWVKFLTRFCIKITVHDKIKCYWNEDIIKDFLLALTSKYVD